MARSSASSSATKLQLPLTKAEISESLRQAIVQTLVVRKRLVWHKLLLFAALRWQRTHKGAKRPSESSVKALVGELVKAGTVVAISMRDGSVAGATGYELAAGSVPKKQPSRKAAEPAKKAPTRLAKGRCYFLSSQVESLFDDVGTAIRGRFEVVSEAPGALRFRWRHKLGCGPEFLLEPCDLATLKRQARVQQMRSLAQDPRGLKGVLVLSFDDVPAVLDETNSLIEAQALIQAVARGPMFLAWNKLLTGD